MKKNSVAAALLLGAISVSSLAQTTATQAVNVTAALTSQCRSTTAGALTLAFGTYVAFQGTAQTATGTSVTFECTRGLAAPIISFDGASALGVIAGLQYEITTAAGAVVPGSAPTISALGTAATYPYSIGGTMPAGQAGSATTGTVTIARTMTITF